MITKLISNKKMQTVTVIDDDGKRTYEEPKGNAFEYRGMSTDEKPIDAKNGDVFIEIDTQKVFFFNGQSWLGV